MNALPVLLLYGIDRHSQNFEIESTLHLVHEATVALNQRGWRVLPQQISDDLAGTLRHYNPCDYVVLNLCEGSTHQESYYARVTQVLGQTGYTFTGSDSWSLDETQYKWRMKLLLEKAGVPTPGWVLREDASDFHFDAFPAIVKPAEQHCSYGITRESVVLNMDEARRQIARCIGEFHQPAMLEEFLDSAEYNVSVWGSDKDTLSRSSQKIDGRNRIPRKAGIAISSVQPIETNDLEVLGISTMTYDYFGNIKDRLCTFDAKWTPESEAYRQIPAICPAPISTRLQRKIERVALQAYKASHCRDYGRVDIRLNRAGEPLVLDVNSNCDVSSEGGFMNAARSKGLDYGQMLERLIKLALARGPNNRNVDAQSDAMREPVRVRAAGVTA
jgi:D-alanine-D-alanine ligase